MTVERYLRLVQILPDQTSHITLKNQKRCKTCDIRACLYVCPSGVFVWDELRETVDVLWHRCVECGACEPACPENVEYRHPRGGYGVRYLT